MVKGLESASLLTWKNMAGDTQYNWGFTLLKVIGIGYK